MPSPALPEAHLLAEQAAWLAPARARLLRRAGIAHRRRVLDLGAGYGVVTPELVRRARALIAALDPAIEALQAHPEAFTGAARVTGEAQRLPFADGVFDLIFSQLTLLWVGPLAAAVRELYRVLAPGGAVVALEPDYGGLIETPPDVATRDLWLAALARAGAHPHVGRQLPGLLAKAGFEVHVDLLDTLAPPSIARFAFLEALPLTAEERERLARARQRAARLSGPWEQAAHLPLFLITARHPGDP